MARQALGLTSTGAVSVLPRPIPGPRFALSHIFRLQNRWVFCIAAGGHAEDRLQLAHPRSGAAGGALPQHVNGGAADERLPVNPDGGRGGYGTTWKGKK